ncbi:class III signal peptide-containing protein [Methanosphaera sp.]
MNNKGQLSVEYILLLGVIIIILISSVIMISNESEKNTILTAAQIGAQNGIDKNGYAMYYNDTFNNYQNNYQKLLTSTEIKLIKINLNENNTIIELQVYAHTNSLTSQEKYIVGSRINYYIRRSISETFNSTPTNIYYDPAKSNKYTIKTKTVIWI